MAEVKLTDGGRPTHTGGTPEQTGARTGAHVVSKQVDVVLATNSLDGTYEDAAESIAQWIGNFQRA